LIIGSDVQEIIPFLYMKNLRVFLILITYISCTGKKTDFSRIANTHSEIKVKILNDKELDKWYYKDIQQDTLPGISLIRAFQELDLPKKNHEVIIAVLDNPIDIHHPAISQHLWINKNEIPKNGIDDDNNGYLDDYKGWNFLGNKNGDVALFQSGEHVRIINKYSNAFRGKNADSILPKDHLNYQEYLRALKAYSADSITTTKEKHYVAAIKKILDETTGGTRPYFPDEEYTLEVLDSLAMIHLRDTTLIKQKFLQNNIVKYENNALFISNLCWQEENRFDYVLNLNFDERAVQGDNGYDIEDKFYGNNNVNWSLDKLTHGTRVASVSVFNALDEFSSRSNLKIMPVVIASFGENHSKDIALAIRYAVDNGANVISMGFIKNFSVDSKWLADALIYAEENNVLVIKAAGNNNDNTDSIDFVDFPTDTNILGKEFVSNFIVVGASTYHLDSHLKANFSNYGKTNIDVFAPGQDIYTAYPNAGFKLDGGTAIASAITAATAGLLFSYYPKLTAAQVKKILIDSGVSYTIPVSIGEGEKLCPFNQLSKSGKIINAYNALLMAEEITK